MGHHHHLEYSNTTEEERGGLPSFLPERTKSSFEEIPVIDFKDAGHPDFAVRRALADLVRDACINIGFFYIKNHGIPEPIIRDVVAAASDFFSLPSDTKSEIDIRKSTNFKGYTGLLAENTNPDGLGDLHEAFDLGWEPDPMSTAVSTPFERDDGEMAGDNVWPPESALPHFKSKVLAYYHATIRLGKMLFSIFALALDLPENFFDDKTTKPAAIMRLLHYPPQHASTTTDDDRIIGIGSHTDYECFTILWQDDIGALQVQNTQGVWIDAIPIPGTLVLNLGDQFARWTNDVFKSTVHRAINRSGRERYSIPLFFGTDYNVPLEPLPGCVTPTTPARYEVITAGEYVKSRLEATYTRKDSSA